MRFLSWTMKLNEYLQCLVERWPENVLFDCDEYKIALHKPTSNTRIFLCREYRIVYKEFASSSSQFLHIKTMFDWTYHYIRKVASHWMKLKIFKKCFKK